MARQPDRNGARPVSVGHFVSVAAASLIVLLAGTAGFMAVINESALNALYRSVNTITTAGEVTPPHSDGGVVTLLVLMSGVVRRCLCGRQR
jgi:hypothetical protein